ncbi:hypothetical protein DFH27DRAFT_572039 [Peziza echinospora]|nr:hypothetical protein DFH27DRAFT_572039 [Peziza echinospora]
MSEGRRQSSTPAASTSAPASSTVDPNSSNDWAIGTRVRVITTLDDIYEGEIYTYDPVTHTLSLYTSPGDFRILKLQYIKDVSVLARAVGGGGGGTGSFPAAVTPVSLQSILERERVSCRAEHERFLTRGVGVSKDAQEVFDALNRTMQCRWGDKGMIVVVDAGVGVVSPYLGGGDCRRLGTGEDVAGERALERVRKVLEGERRRMEERKRAVNNHTTMSSSPSTSSTTTVTPAIQGNNTSSRGGTPTPSHTPTPGVSQQGNGTATAAAGTVGGTTTPTAVLGKKGG